MHFTDSSEPLTKSHYKRVMATHAKKLPLGRPARESTGTLDGNVKIKLLVYRVPCCQISDIITK